MQDPGAEQGESRVQLQEPVGEQRAGTAERDREQQHKDEPEVRDPAAVQTPGDRVDGADEQTAAPALPEDPAAAGLHPDRQQESGRLPGECGPKDPRGAGRGERHQRHHPARAQPQRHPGPHHHPRVDPQRPLLRTRRTQSVEVRPPHGPGVGRQSRPHHLQGPFPTISPKSPQRFARSNTRSR